jgi:hypothetical protein
VSYTGTGSHDIEIDVINELTKCPIIFVAYLRSLDLRYAVFEVGHFHLTKFN